ncbi:MAG: hypothetical protein Q9193_001437 [Seirophora villosa]
MPWSIPSTIKCWFLGRESSSPSRDRHWTTHVSNLTALFCLSRPSPPRPALPPEIILQILAHPTRWLLGRSQSSTHILVSEQQKPIITLPPFSAEDLHWLRRVVFRFRSRDQGYSWDSPNHGTYNASWTWFEAVVPEQREDGVGAADVPPDSDGVRKRWELQRNRHAGTQFEDYEIVFEQGDTSMMELKEVMRVGDRLELRACAAFPAWENRVEEAHVELWYQDDLCSRSGSP